MKTWVALACASFLLSAGVCVARADSTLPVGGTRVGATVFLDASHIDQSIGGVRAATKSGNGVDLQRLYFILDHRFSQVWSAHLLADVNWKRQQDPTNPWVKHAYLQGAFSKAFVLRIGAAATPWIGLTNQWYGYRYVETDVLSRAKVGTTADWGVHALGTLGSAQTVSYAVAAITGAGYKEPRLGNGPDTVVRVAWQPLQQLVLAIGGYSGTLAQAVDGRSAQHTARRSDVMLAWADAHWRLGGQCFRTTDWMQVTTLATGHVRGCSAWASAQLTPRFAAFVRHDRFGSDASTGQSLRDRYSHAGIEWRAQAWLRLAMVYKHEHVTGSTTPSKTLDEIGVWSQWSF